MVTTQNGTTIYPTKNLEVWFKNDNAKASEMAQPEMLITIANVCQEFANGRPGQYKSFTIGCYNYGGKLQVRCTGIQHTGREIDILPHHTTPEGLIDYLAVR